jgi:hypothetical protein
LGWAIQLREPGGGLMLPVQTGKAPERPASLAGNSSLSAAWVYALAPGAPGVPNAPNADSRRKASLSDYADYRLVFAPDAVAYEPAADSSKAEFARKVRITTRGLHGVLVMRQLLNPFRYGFYSVELFSHKVMRRLVVFPLLLLLIVSPLLWTASCNT